MIHGIFEFQEQFSNQTKHLYQVLFPSPFYSVYVEN